MAPALFQPITLAGLTLPNRIVVAPMCQYSAVDGQAQPWHVVHLGTLAASGAGLLILEAAAVEPVGRITPGDLGIWSDATERALAGVLDSVRRVSAMPIGIQLGHAGRKASSRAPWEGGHQLAAGDGGWLTVAPSAVPHAVGEAPPAALDEAGLRRVRDAFVAAAQRSVRLGLQYIELHAAHGYLLHQFLSPLANHRGDAYGGSLDNRMRFPLEVLDAVRAAVPASVPVGLRVSASDWVDGGWDLDGTVALALASKARGADYIHVSSGGVSPQQKIAIGPCYQVAFAAAVKAASGLPTIAVGLITDPAQAEAIVADGQADMVALARGILYDPRWPWHAAAALGGTVAAPKQYWRSQPHGLSGLFGAVSQGQR